MVVGAVLAALWEINVLSIPTASRMHRRDSHSAFVLAKARVRAIRRHAAVNIFINFLHLRKPQRTATLLRANELASDSLREFSRLLFS